jgi:hypothetical protein
MTASRQAVMEELVHAQPRLLRTQLIPASGALELWQAVVLTFDVARLVVAPNPQGDEITLRVDAGQTPVPAGAVETEEEEPWWRVLGNPLHGAWAQSDPEHGQIALELQFRPREANPKIIAIELAGGALQVRLKPTSTLP